MQRPVTLYGLETENIITQAKPALIFFAAVVFVLTLIAFGVPILIILAINAILCAGYIAFTNFSFNFSLDFELEGDEVKKAIEKDLFNM